MIMAFAVSWLWALLILWGWRDGWGKWLLALGWPLLLAYLWNSASCSIDTPC